MHIGVIGGGNIGGTTAKLFADAGHEVAIANSRGPETLTELVEEIGPNARAATVDDAASFGEVVLVAIPFGRYRELPVAPLDGKIVVDANNYYPGRDGVFPELEDDSTTSTELLAEHLPGSRVVKAFNSIVWRTLRDRGHPDAREDRLVVFLAGNDAAANDTVSELIEEIGFAPVVSGDLGHGGRLQQRDGPLYGKELTQAEAEEALA
jgi:predicted dinucleotide-binding enzyme